MEQTTYCQTDVQSIMQRLRGNGNPYTPPKAAPQAPQASSSEINELKTIVKVLGAKLKDATQELSDSKAALISSEQSHQTLRDTIEQLESSLTAKNHDLAAAKNDHRQVQLTIEQLERDCIELRTKNAAPTPSPDLAFMREELLASRADLLKLQEERKQLGAALEHERQKGRSETSNTNGQLVRLAMNCKQLEEEVHSLTCERAATFRQFNQLKELMSASQKELSAEREKIHEEKNR